MCCPKAGFSAALRVTFVVEIYFYSLIQSESLHPLGGRWRVAPDEGYLRQNAAVLRPHQSPAVTASPLFVTCGDISPRRGENLSLPGEAFSRKAYFHGFLRVSVYASGK